MKTNLRKTACYALGLLAAMTAARCRAQEPDPHAPAVATTLGTARVADQNNWRRECIRHPVTGEPLCDVVYFGTAKVNASLPTAGLGVDVNRFDEDTTIVLAAGNPQTMAEGYGYETYRFRLGRDPRYRPGKRSARIPIVPYGASRPWGWATINWSTTRLNVRITTQKFSDFFELRIRRENGAVTRDLELDFWVEGHAQTLTSRFQVSGRAVTEEIDAEERFPTKYRVTGQGPFSPGARPCCEWF